MLHDDLQWYNLDRFLRNSTVSQYDDGQLAENNELPSVSFQTIPSSVTEVPGSRGPKHSGSVIVPISVPTLASTCNKEEEKFMDQSHYSVVRGDRWYVALRTPCRHIMHYTKPFTTEAA